MPVYLLLPVSVFGLYFFVLAHAWTWDDTAILEHVYRYSPWEYFFVPDAWRELSSANLTPWVSLSFELDFALFGLAPLGYYGHHLLSLSWVAIALFLLLRLWLSRLWSLLGVLLWLASAPMQTLVHQLMTRHYLEGLGFALLALLFYVNALRTGRWQWLLGGTLFYALACSAKEIYVPLILLLPFLPEADVRRRFFYLLPLAGVACAYVGWRFYMLGVLLGGYGQPVTPQAVLNLPLLMMQKLFGNDPLSLGVALVLLGFLILYAIWHYNAARWLIPLMLFLTLAPLIPALQHLVNADTYRLLILPSVVLAVGVVLILGQSRFMLYPRMLILGVLLSLLLMQNFQARQALKPQVERFAAHASFIQQSPSHYVLLDGLNWADTRLRWLQQRVIGKTPPSLVFDLSQIEHLEDKRFFQYDALCACVREVTRAMPQRLQDWRDREKQAPLSVQISEHNRLISWQFAPYREGSYTLINAELFGLMVLPAQGQVRGNVPEPLRFRLRYDAPEGWHTYSPWLLLPHRGSRVEYVRGEEIKPLNAH